MAGYVIDSHPQSQFSGETPDVFSPAGLLPLIDPISSQLEKVFQSFWGRSKPIRLLSIAQNPHYFWHMNDFYVAQKGLDSEGRRWAQLRLSEGLCQMLFESTLGKPWDEPDFRMSQIRNFEVFLLERFSRRLFHIFSDMVIASPHGQLLMPEQEGLVHMAWMLQSEAEQASQIVLTLPQSCVKSAFEVQTAPKIWHLSENNFLHAHSDVTICVGRTRARLDELQQLEPQDIIVFEDSRLNAWQIKHPKTGVWYRFEIKIPEERKQPDLRLKQGLNTMAQEMQTKPNIWDNLQVEVTAQFNPLKMPLKQLKEMEQGLVLEVGDIMDNKIQVEVEGHPVAWGELLVLGDKFAVRILELQDAVEQTTSKTYEPTPEAVPVAQQQQQQEETQETFEEQEHPSEEEQPFESNTLMDLDLDESDFDDLDDDEDWT